MIDIQLFLLSLIFCLTRWSPIFLLPGLTPFSRIPANIRIVIMFVMSISTLATFEDITATSGMSSTQMIFALVNEFLLGMALNFGLQTAFGVMQFVGRLIDMQIGFGAAGVLDPMTSNMEALVGTFFSLCALQLFFHLNFHHELLRGFVLSLRLVPLGSSTGLMNYDWLRGFGVMFIYSLMLAAPVIISLLLLDVVIAYSSRSMPQMNVYFVSLPVKAIVGLIVLSLTIRTVAPTFARIFEQSFSSWRSVIVH